MFPTLPILPITILFAPNILPNSIKHSSTQPLIWNFCSFKISSILLLSTILLSLTMTSSVRSLSVRVKTSLLDKPLFEKSNTAMVVFCPQVNPINNSSDKYIRISKSNHHPTNKKPRECGT